MRQINKFVSLFIRTALRESSLTSKYKISKMPQKCILFKLEDDSHISILPLNFGANNIINVIFSFIRDVFKV